MEPTRCLRHTLLYVMGLSPEIITKTLYCLVVKTKSTVNASADCNLSIAMRWNGNRLGITR